MPKAQEQTPPDVERGDEVYFRHKSGPACGKVLARGAHGVTLDHEGQRRQVRWEDLHGHKVKLRPEVKVVDQGEDGMIVEAQGGQRRYVHDPIEPPKEDRPLRKAMPVALLFTSPEELAKALKNKPGLTLQTVTDKAGHQTKRWKRSAGDRGPCAPAAGPMDGRVVGQPGEHGAHVQTDTGETHQVPWDAMKDAGDGPLKPPLYDEARLKDLPAKAAQPHRTWEDLKEHGAEGLGQFKDALTKVADQLHLRTDLKPEQLQGDHLSSKDGFLFLAPLKGEQRAKEEVEADYGGDWSKLRDMVRGTISVAGMDELREATKAVEAAGLKLAQKPNDRFAKPTASGYRDLMVNVRLPNGMLAELQFHLKAMTAAKTEGHSHYETERGLAAKYGEEEPSDAWSDKDHSAFYAARKSQKQIYGKAWSGVQPN